MGIYYQPPLASIGGQQPLTPQHVPPPSGPPPSNPIFGAVSLVATLVAAWSASAAPLPQRPSFLPPLAANGPPPYTPGTPAAILAWWQPAPFLPPAAVNLDPPIAGPPSQPPPLNGGAAVPLAIFVQWVPPPSLPPSAILLEPPIGGPVPQAPPVNGGAQVSKAVLVQWLPPPPLPPGAINLDPPISGPAPQAPPLRTLQPNPFWPGIDYLLPQRSSFIPPAAGGTPPLRWQGPGPDILAWWPPPAPLPPVAINLDPPIAGPTPQAPPLTTRPLAVDVSWLSGGYAQPQRAPLGAVLLPPIIAGPPTGYRAGQVEIEIWWNLRQDLPPVAAQLHPPISGPVPQAPPLAARRLTVEAFWGGDYAMPQRAPSGVPLLPSFAGGPPPGYRAGAIEIEIWWNARQELLPPIVRLNLPISGPPPQAPPILGAVVPKAVLVQWLPLPPSSPAAINLKSPIGLVVTPAAALVFDRALALGVPTDVALAVAVAFDAALTQGMPVDLALAAALAKEIG